MSALVTVRQGEQRLLGHEGRLVRSVGRQHAAREGRADTLQVAERRHRRREIIALLQVAERLLRLGHDHPRRVHQDEILQPLLVITHGHLPLHAGHNLLVGEVNLRPTTLQLLREICLEPFVNFQ